LVEAEPALEKAESRQRGIARDQRQRRSWIFATAGSYAVDTAFLALFASAGTIPASVAGGYGAAAAAIIALNLAVTASGWNLKARDPAFTAPLTLVAVFMQLGVVWFAPQLGFPFLANLFTVFAFAMIWLSLRESVVIWTLGAAGAAAVIFGAAPIGVPVATRFETFLVWLYFSLILGRCLVLSVTANAMRARLADSRRRLADSLEQVRLLASHDELTQTLNRRSLMARIAQERSRAERGIESFSVAIFDLDHFKQVNDTHGHAIGDQVLRDFAAIVRETMRVTDVFGRYGGEEFLLILVGIEAPSAAGPVERIRRAVEAKDWAAVAPELRVTVSAGLAHYRKGETVEELLHRADMALYDAKRAGRNRVVAVA